MNCKLCGKSVKGTKCTFFKSIDSDGLDYYHEKCFNKINKWRITIRDDLGGD